MTPSFITLAALISIVVAQQGNPTGYASLNGGTTGGKGGATVTVSTLAQMTAALVKRDDTPKVVYVKGTITGSDKIYVGSNKSVLGLDSTSALVGVGLQLQSSKNVIVQNLRFSKILAANGDAITIQASTNVWVDHVDVSSDTDHGKDYYDGLIDVVRASDFVTISNTYFHDHYKVSLVGNSDSQGSTDTGHLRVTYHNNYWHNVGSRTPSIRFGTGHIFNSFYDSVFINGIDTRENAQVLVESTAFTNTTNDIGFYDSKVTGYAVVRDVDLGGGTNTAPAGTLTNVPYAYTLVGSANVKGAVVGKAGNTLKLG
ncbi:polysaccharide lyase family 1 protein [Myriangium duriaei CBS 260.36]|uniref:pectate lyase n=1 Tax=Myriangium duriaei CBS 260.36 TaxID=1168546 RepID=A0A9P4J0P9_9PEZI|nr:polysaccharide lyase family 1 protein [Myriangium duriaei CBS 260.36]